MPKIVIPVENTDTTVSRLIAKTVIQELLFSAEIPEINDIVYIPRGGVTAMPQLNDVNEALKLDATDRIKVEYNEVDVTTAFDINKYQFEYPPIFGAPKLGVSLMPMHRKMTMELTFTYISKSYATLISFLNAFNRRLLNAEAMNYHDILYNYIIPDDALAYIQQVYALTENVAPYHLTLTDFLKNHFASTGVVVRRNLNDTQQSLAVNVKNTGCLGLFTELPQLIETSKEPPISSVSFSYSLNYDRITAVNLEYQHYVHNQVIDLQFLRKYADRRLHSNMHAGNRTFCQSVNAVTENQYGLFDYPDNEVNTGDGWRPPITPEASYTSIILPIQLDLNDLYNIVDLHILTDYGYPSWLITLIHQYRVKITQFQMWPIHIDMFEVNATVSKVPVVITDSLQLTSQVALNPRNRNYMRMLVLTNLLKMDFSDLKKDPINFLHLLQWINKEIPNFSGTGDMSGIGIDSRFRNNDINIAIKAQTNANRYVNDITNHTVYLKTIGDGAYITDDSLWKVLNVINNTDYSRWNANTVLSTTLTARRKPKNTIDTLK